MSGERQEAFDSVTDIKNGSGIHGMLVPFSKPGAQLANKLIDQRRRDVGEEYVLVEEPLLEVPVVAGGLAEAVDVEIPVKQMPQKRFPAGGQPWEAFDKGSGKPFEDFAELLLIRRISGILANGVFAHGHDLKREAGGRKLTRLLRRPPIPASQTRRAAWRYDFLAVVRRVKVAEEEPKIASSYRGAGQVQRPSMETCLFEFTAPQVKRHRGERMLAADHEAVNQKVRCGFVGVGLEPGERRPDDFFGVAMEFGYEGRQKGERVAARGAEESPDRDGVSLRQTDETAYVASVPSQAVVALADLAGRGFGRPLFLEALKVFVDFGFEQ